MSHWDGKSRGNALGYKIFLFLIRKIGIQPAYFLLKFVSFYFYLAAYKPRNIILKFYLEGLGYSKLKATRLVRKNFFLMGQTLIDRSAILLNKAQKLSFEFENENALIELERGGKGGILMSAHLGNWESAGNLMKSRVSSTFNVLMVDEEVQKIRNALKAAGVQSKFNIIPIKEDLSHIFKIQDVLSQNQIVAMHADRFVEGGKTLLLPFLGKTARFPLGPFVLATRFKAPVCFVFAVKTRKFHYSLSSTSPITGILQPEELARLYVTKLEEMVKKHPEQWYNYFEFFSHADTPGRN